MNNVELIRTDSSNSEFISLVRLLDQELAIRDGEEHAFYAQFNKIDAIRHVVIVFVDDTPAGCGAFKKYADTTAEVKRMFVRPELRSRGLAARILGELESWAGEEGFVECVLETSLKQQEAIRLYEKSGYQRIPNYAQYEGVENSVCMRKELIR